MPELPEVETIVRELAPALAGLAVVRLRVLDDRLAVDRPARARGRRVAAVRRVGKHVVIELAPAAGRNGGAAPLFLVVHLRMTGRLLFGPTTRPHRARRQVGGPPPHARACLELDGGRLWFSDTRRFGTLTLTDAPDVFAANGLDPLTRAFTGSRLAALIAGSVTPIKTWLLRQDRLAGIGNIYASEALFAAGIDPRRPARDLSREESAVLAREIKRVLRAAIRHNGTTFADFQRTTGSIGDFQRYLAVYQREGEPCKRCRKPIERVVQQQRSTYYCPRCQS